MFLGARPGVTMPNEPGPWPLCLQPCPELMAWTTLSPGGKEWPAGERAAWLSYCIELGGEHLAWSSLGQGQEARAQGRGDKGLCARHKGELKWRRVHTLGWGAKTPCLSERVPGSWGETKLPHLLLQHSKSVMSQNRIREKSRACTGQKMRTFSKTRSSTCCGTASRD